MPVDLFPADCIQHAIHQRGLLGMPPLADSKQSLAAKLSVLREEEKVKKREQQIARERVILEATVECNEK